MHVLNQFQKHNYDLKIEVDVVKINSAQLIFTNRNNQSVNYH